MTDLVKYFNNSELSINLTSILILNNDTNEFEPWFIAKEVATLLGYEKTKEAVNRHVDELDQKILSYNECKELFGQNIISDETLENAEDFRGPINEPPKNTININSQGMKFINESGLYTLIARSDKREARKFQRSSTRVLYCHGNGKYFHGKYLNKKIFGKITFTEDCSHHDKNVIGTIVTSKWG